MEEKDKRINGISPIFIRRQFNKFDVVLDCLFGYFSLDPPIHLSPLSFLPIALGE